jgi:hypothetical protein
VLAVTAGVAALASVVGLILAIPLAGPMAPITWTFVKLTGGTVILAMFASLAAGGKRGVLGFASGAGCLVSAAAVADFIGLGLSGKATGPILGVVVGLFVLLAVLTPVLAVAAGIARWRHPVPAV